jgi:hypothetical protein
VTAIPPIVLRLSISLLALLILTLAPAIRAENKPDTKRSDRPAATKPAEEERAIERLVAIKTANNAAIDYAKKHEQAIPTTEELAKHMGIAPKDFAFRVVLSGSLDKHMKLVKGGWPEVLIAEKRGGEGGKWAFGYVDGLCSLRSAAAYKEDEDSAALQAIAEATTKPSSEGRR